MMQANYVVLSLEQVTYRDFVRVFERYHGIPWQILETKRCRLREFCMDDLDDLFALYAKPHVTDFIEPLYAYEQERLYEETYIERIYGFYGFGMWLVFEKDSGELIGRAGLEYREPCREGEAELGYLITPEHWRKAMPRKSVRRSFPMQKTNSAWSGSSAMWTKKTWHLGNF